MDSTTLAAKSTPPFRPTGLSQPRRTIASINASVADSVEGRRRGCLETQDDLENWSTQRLGPKWVSSTEIEPTTGDYIVDVEVAVIRRRHHVTATYTRCLLDADHVKLKGKAFARNIFGKMRTTRKASELQEGVFGNATKTKRNKRRCEIGPANDAGFRTKRQSPKTRILNSRSSRLVDLCTLAMRA
ncbi:hypothetical protein MRX96_003166 [Rhipicephalus microplus]